MIKTPPFTPGSETPPSDPRALVYPVRPRIPARLARRIDRLARRAHTFHRLAHHPLCQRYADEVVRLGHSLRVCRGCLFAAAGGAAGLAFGIALRPGPMLVGSALAASALLALASRWMRLPKFAGRLAPAALVAFAVGGGLAAAAIAALGVLAWTARYRRAGPDRAPCASCPERGEKICSGLSPMVRRERAFQRLAARWLGRSSHGLG